MVEKIMFVLRVFPVIILAVTALEEAIPGSGYGTVKREIIVNAVLAIDEAAENMVPLLTSVIGVVVAGFNAVGVFEK